MKSKGKFGFLLLIVLFLGFPSVNAWEIDKQGTVSYVLDGDTFELTDSTRVRLGDVSAPETYELGGPEATSILENLIDGKKVFLDTDPVLSYGRFVSVVYIKHNTTHYKNINWVLLQQDYFTETDYPNEFNPSEWTEFVQYYYPPPEPEPDPDPPPEPPPSPPPSPPPDPPSPPTPPPPPEYDLTIQVEGQGTIDHPTGTKTYEENTEITITATPKEYWKIENWILNGEPQTNQNTLKITLTQDTQLIIQFSIFLPDCSTLFKITDEHGKPIENASIESTKKPEYQNQILLVSGADGEAEIAPLYHGNYIFKIEKEGYNSRTIEIWLDKDEPRYEEISLEITKIELCITLTDSSGNPLVLVEVLSSSQPENQEQVSGVTNNEGIIIFSDVLPGSYSFDIIGDYVESRIMIETGISETSFDERITLFSELTGFVYDKEGNPLEEVEVFSVSEPDDQESLSCVCDGQFNFSRVLSGSYTFTIQKSGYYSVNHSIFLIEGTTGVIDSVTLFPIRQNYSPLILTSMFIGAGVIAFYLLSEKSFLFKTKTPEQRINDVSEQPIEVEKRPSPLYFDSDKGAIIKTICVDGFNDLSDIQENSGLEDYRFWDAFYELITEGELESNERGLYRVRDDIQKQWHDFADIQESPTSSKERIT